MLAEQFKRSSLSSNQLTNSSKRKKDFSQIVCHYCQKKGHLKRQCLKKKADDKREHGKIAYMADNEKSAGDYKAGDNERNVIKLKNDFYGDDFAPILALNVEDEYYETFIMNLMYRRKFYSQIRV